MGLAVFSLCEQRVGKKEGAGNLLGGWGCASPPRWATENVLPEILCHRFSLTSVLVPHAIHSDSHVYFRSCHPLLIAFRWTPPMQLEQIRGPHLGSLGPALLRCRPCALLSYSCSLFLPHQPHFALDPVQQPLGAPEGSGTYSRPGVA